MKNKGQALVEYVLIIGIVAALVISLVTVFGGYLKDAVTKISCSVADQEYEAGNKPGMGQCVESEDIFNN